MAEEPARQEPQTIRLPGFVTGDEQIGLGDVIKRATASVGIRPCGGCAARAEWLNRKFEFTPRSHGRG